MVLALAALLLLAADDDRPWRQAGEGPGTLRWYTRPVADSPIDELRATGLIDGPAEDVWAVLVDYEAYTTVMPHTAAAKVLESDGAVAYVHYVYTIPLLSPRDTVVRVETSHDPEKRVWTMTWKEAPEKDALVPPARGVTRLKVNEGRWTVQSYQGKAVISYHLHSVPGGRVPPVLINQFNGSGVPGTFKALQKAVIARVKARAGAGAPH